MDASQLATNRRVAQQLLESLQRAGIQQLPLPLHVTATVAALSTESAPNVAIDAGPPGLDHAAAASVAEIQAIPPAEAPAISIPLADKPLDRESHMPRKANAKAPVTATPKKLSLAAKKEHLGTLCEQIKDCRLCPSLVENRTQTVFGVGNPNTRLCFFGEAPGADEDRQGEPFVGRAGQLLDRIIEACTLRRRDVYILNTVKCRPPQNRNPEPDEVDNCRQYFEQQLEIIRPEFICCLGLVSAKALLGTTEAVGKLRGKLHPWRWAQVLVTYHPAYLLRNPAAKKEVWKDMQFLMKEMGIDLAQS